MHIVILDLFKNTKMLLIEVCHVQVINATGQVDFNFSIGLM